MKRKNVVQLSLFPAERPDVVETRNGQAAVLWVGDRWTLRYSGGVVEGLNQHGAAQLRRLAR